MERGGGVYRPMSYNKLKLLIVTNFIIINKFPIGVDTPAKEGFSDPRGKEIYLKRW
jgi:hypothetical protein